MDFIPINFTNKLHNNIIYNLAYKNNFYSNEIFYLLYENLDNNCYGYFVKSYSYKKIIGFIIYDIDKLQFKSHLLFLLVDSIYQNKGVGTKLVQKYIEDIEHHFLHIHYAEVDIKNDTLTKFYSKFGFSKYYSFIICSNNNLIYIPKKSLFHILLHKKSSL